MKFSRMFIPTTKETPKDASLPSHQYLVRGGFVNQVGAGIYNFMPLGKIVLEKIRNLVKSELDHAGCNEVQLGFVTPIELWEQSGRASKMGLEMLRIKDRKGGNFVLSPTNEEAMVELVKNRVTSYKDLPLNLYQINTKFRDEGRPRFGLLRGREFLMKDGYSFHESEEDMIREFHLMEETYKKIFTRLGLDFRVVEADSGAIGGTGSKEFHVLANSGEDTLVVCDSCDYGANIEAAKRTPKVFNNINNINLGKVLTPNKKTIEEVCDYLKIDSSQTVKAVIKKAIYEDKTELVVFFVRGSDILEETKACNSVNALELVDTTDEDLENAKFNVGYVGVVGLPDGIKFVIDSELEQSNSVLITGANEDNYHCGIRIDAEGAFTQEMVGEFPHQQTGKFLFEEFGHFADLVSVQEGDVCPHCQGTLRYTKGIEVGHIFQLGTKYSASMNANFLDRNGKAKPFVMGTYGIGVSRLISAVIEQHHDDKGMIWTKETAPFMVDIIVSNAKNEDEMNFANHLYDTLHKFKIETILDDRIDARYGFKMGDFELIGFPYGIIVGKKLADGIVEIVDRKTNTKIEVQKGEVVGKMMELIG